MTDVAAFAFIVGLVIAFACVTHFFGIWIALTATAAILILSASE